MKVSRQLKVKVLGAVTLAIALIATFITINLTAQPALSIRPAPPAAQAIGTEPFWNVTVTPKGIVYSTPEIKPITFPYTKPIQAQGRPEDATFIYRLQKGQQQGILTFQKNTCNDGMSDRLYDYSTILYLNNQVRAGCGIGPMLGIATP
jgi:uncharacterized membrane protein